MKLLQTFVLTLTILFLEWGHGSGQRLMIVTYLRELHDRKNSGRQ